MGQITCRVTATLNQALVGASTAFMEAASVASSLGRSVVISLRAPAQRLLSWPAYAAAAQAPSAPVGPTRLTAMLQD